MRYQDPPRLTKYDGRIGPLRHWTRQFYPLTSPNGHGRRDQLADTASPQQAEDRKGSTVCNAT